MPPAINFGHCNALLISKIIEQELEDFLENLHIHPAPDLQYSRSGLIAWFCVFFPEAVMKGQRDKIVDAVTELKSQDEYIVSDWYRLPFLEVSAYALTRKFNFLETIISNIDHHSSQLRRILHAPLALVAPDLNFNTPGLHQSIVSNFARAHFFIIVYSAYYTPCLTTPHPSLPPCKGLPIAMIFRLRIKMLLRR